MKTILITGSTDGIGLATARRLVQQGHRVLVHGRSAEKVSAARQVLAELVKGQPEEGFVADLSRPAGVNALACEVVARYGRLDVLINNAGVFQVAKPRTPEGFDVRFAVNTLAPYWLTRRLLPLMERQGRVVNLASAAQAPVDLEALRGSVLPGDAFAAYAQSKLALIMWSKVLADELGDRGPAVIAVNPGSLLASKMVKEGFGVDGSDLGIGADILMRAAVEGEFAHANGHYFDNDAQRFAPPHADALNAAKRQAVQAVIEATLKQWEPATAD